MKNKRIFTAVLVTLFIILTLLGCSSASDDATATKDTADDEVRVINASTSGNPRPYTYQAEDGTLTGYDIELAQAIFDLIPEYDLEIELAELQSCLTGLSSGRYQFVINNLGYTEERGSYYIFQGPLNHKCYAIITKEGNDITALSDIVGLYTEAEPSVILTEYLESYFKAVGVENNISYTEKQPAQQYQDLEDGTIEYMLSDVVSYNTYIEEYGYTDLQYYLLTDDENNELSGELTLPYVYFCFAPEEEELIEAVTEAMKEYKESGDWTELSLKWFGVDLTPSVDEIDYWNYTVEQ